MLIYEPTNISDENVEEEVITLSLSDLYSKSDEPSMLNDFFLFSISIMIM